ncbi:MAG: GAF domain-containing protein [Anaerolineales bacterium]
MADNTNPTLESQLAALVEVMQVSTSILLPHSTHELLDSIVEAAARIFGARSASIALVREEESVLEFVTAYGPAGDQIIGRKIPVDSGLAGFVVMTEQALVISDVEHDPRFDRAFAASTGYVPNSILAAPLDRGGRVVGVMEVLDKVDATGFAIQDLELMEIFGRQAAIAIEQTDMLDQLDHLLQDGLTELANSEEGLQVDALLDAVAASRGRGEGGSDLREMAEHVSRLYAAGPEERRVCLGMLQVISDYVDRRQALR